MRLLPFTEVDTIPFDISQERLLARLGPPRHAGANTIGLAELDYGDGVYRFQQSSGRLEEVTRHAPVLHLGAVAIPFPALADFITTQDPDAFERAGFLVSPAFGIAFVPGVPDWVTALARHCIPSWRAL